MSYNNTDRFSDGYSEYSISKGDAYNNEEKADLASSFKQNGWVYLGQVLSPAEVSAFVAVVNKRLSDNRVIADPEFDYLRKVSSMRMFEYSKIFLSLLTKEPIIGFIEDILGTDCHLICQNVLVSGKGEGIIRWHIDDELFFPFKLYDYNEVPCFSLNVMIPLTDVDEMELGPTQVIPETHLSGTYPPERIEAPTFRNNSVKTLYAKKGEAYVLNSQLWHRGSQNTSNQIRYLITMTFGKRFISQRFYPFLNYRCPEHVIVNANQRQLRLLGKHDKGPYG